MRQRGVVLGLSGGGIEPWSLVVHAHVMAVGRQLDDRTRLEGAERLVAPCARHVAAHRRVRAMPHDRAALWMLYHEHASTLAASGNGYETDSRDDAQRRARDV